MDKYNMQDQGSTASFSPSFSTYSSNHHLADIAAKVTREINHLEKDIFFALPRNKNDDVEESSSSSNDEDEDDHDFEFVFVRGNPEGKETTYPIFPIFDRDLLFDQGDGNNHGGVIRLPLKELFTENQDPPSWSSSSSDEDELEGVSPGTYCVWRPSPSPSPSPSRCKKSNSTGSSSKRQRWRLRDLLRLKRSNSEGKESFIYLKTDNKPYNTNDKKKESEDKAVKGKSGKVKAAKEKGIRVSAYEVFYVRSKALKEGEKRRSYLPYKINLF